MALKSQMMSLKVCLAHWSAGEGGLLDGLVTLSLSFHQNKVMNFCTIFRFSFQSHVKF